MKMKSEDKQKTVQAILQMLNGLMYADAKEILDATNEKILDALIIILPEAKQPLQDNSTIERLIDSRIDMKLDERDRRFVERFKQINENLNINFCEELQREVDGLKQAPR